MACIPCQVYERHRGERYPLSWLRGEVRERLKYALEGPIGNTGLISFGEIFGYSRQQIRAISERSRVSDFPYSRTLDFLAELETRRYTVQDVQHALEVMRVAAADIIPAHIEAIVQFGLAQQERQATPSRYPVTRDGQMNSESSDCLCDQCCARSQSFNQSRGSHQSPVPPYHIQISVPSQPSAPSGQRQPSAPSLQRQFSFSPRMMNGRTSQPSSIYVRNPEPVPLNIQFTGPAMNDNIEDNRVNNNERYDSDMSQHFHNDLDSSINSVDRLSMQSLENDPSANAGGDTGLLANGSRVEAETVTNGSQNAPCPCESCRLKSDQHQTLRLVPADTPTVSCTSNSMATNYMTTNSNVRSPSTQNSASQNRSRFTRTENNGSDASISVDSVAVGSRTADDTQPNYTAADGTRHTKTGESAACHETSRTQRHDDANHGDSNHGDGNRVCSCRNCRRTGMVICRTMPPPHLLGDNPRQCRYCSGFVSSLHSRGRMSEGSGMETAGEDKRHSWHGENSPSDTDSVVSGQSLSDSQLHVNGSRQESANTSSQNSNRASYETYSIIQHNGITRAVSEIAVSGNSQQESNDRRGSGQGLNDRRNRRFVFITYSWDGYETNHIQEVLHLCAQLRNAGIEVRMDMDAVLFDRIVINKVEWLDTMTAQAVYIIACISPSYYEDTRQTDTISPAMNQLNARYVFDKLRLEYYNQMSMNYRVIPVIFENSGATEQHIPHCLASTLIYTYPYSVQAIIDRIQRPNNVNLLQNMMANHHM